MTFANPAQQPQQGQSRQNRMALWVNSYKNASSQPDYKGSIEISYALFAELSEAFNSGRYVADRGGSPCIKLDIGLYAQPPEQSSSGKAKPVLSGWASTVSETEAKAQARAGLAQQQPAYQQPVQPAQPAYQQPAQPAAPVGPVIPVPGAIHGQPGHPATLPQGF